MVDNIDIQRSIMQLQAKLERQLKAVETTKANIAILTDFAKRTTAK